MQARTQLPLHPRVLRFASNILSLSFAASTVSPTEEIKCHEGGPQKQMVELGVVCADLSGEATDTCDGACRAYWSANYTKCLAAFWEFIPASFRPPYDRVKEACSAAVAESEAGLFAFPAFRE
jgi:hypothetical protein